MSVQRRPSLQDIIKRRQHAEFVGRENYLDLFRRNLELAPEEYLNANSYSRCLDRAASVNQPCCGNFAAWLRAQRALVTLTDDAERDVPSTLGRMAEQFAQQGHELKNFSERYRVYRQRRLELEADPDAPQGFSAFLGRSLVKGGMRAARLVPGGDIAAEFIDEESLATQASEWMTFLARKLGNKDEVHLLQNPIDVLTPLFLGDLQKILRKTCNCIVL